MARHSKTRPMLKWIGTALCVLLVVSWIWGIWCHVTVIRYAKASSEPEETDDGGAWYPATEVAINLGHGCVQFSWDPSADPIRHNRWKVYTDYSEVDTSIFGVGFYLGGLPAVDHRSYGYLYVLVPYWLILALVLVPTAGLWWLDRRRFPPGHCQKCGYDLTGNVSGRCSECGTPVVPAPSGGTANR